MDHLIVTLSPDHPGFNDAVYRERRNAIATIAREHQTGDPVPNAPYTPEEHDVWRLINDMLMPLHEQHVAPDLHAMTRALELPTTQIPQLAEVNDRLARAGFAMEPVAGLVDASVFLQHLGNSVFLSTQYIRHASRPLYTPEPDVVHELIGHAASLLHPGVRKTSRLFGACAADATPEEIVRLTRVYWYTLEFGLVEHDGALKAVGAGLLSSIGELERSVLSDEVERVAFDPDVTADRPYDPTTFQAVYDVAPDLDTLLSTLDAWLAAGGWRIEA